EQAGQRRRLPDLHQHRAGVLTEPTDSQGLQTPSETPAAAPVKARRRRLPSSGPGWIMLISLLAVLLVGGVALVTRFGVNSAPGLLFVEARANGMKIGRFRRLQ